MQCYLRNRYALEKANVFILGVRVGRQLILP